MKKLYFKGEQGVVESKATGRFVLPSGLAEGLRAIGRYEVTYYNPDGSIGWTDVIENLIPTVGKNYILDNALAGSAFTAAYYMGLVDYSPTPTYAAGDTMASHSGWVESSSYSNGTRPAISWNAASGGSKAATTTTFNINATDTISGVFMSTNSTKGGTTGTLISCGNFSGSNQAVSSGGTLQVTYTMSV